MKKLWYLIIMLLCVQILPAQQVSFSDSVKISLITCSPGPELYARFGHTGIRVLDTVRGVDVVYNYGLFSFNTENFYLKFIKGETDYSLGVVPTSYFLPEYVERNSMVWEQELNLTINEKEKLLGLLQQNYLPENRMYRYNFVFDNCATRPRDIFLKSINGLVVMKPSLDEPKTFRQWVGVYVGEHSWAKFGIDLLFGMDADRNATQFESLFLPEVLMNEFQTATIKHKDSVGTRKLIAQKNILVQSNPSLSLKQGWLKSPFVILCAVCFIVFLISVYDFWKKRHNLWFDSVLLLISGFAGILVFYLMFYSAHPLVKNNLNILWLNPFNIIIALLIWLKPLRLYMMFVQIANVLLLVLTLLLMAISVQSFNVAIFPLIVTLLIRYSAWILRTKRILFKSTRNGTKLIKNRSND